MVYSLTAKVYDLAAIDNLAQNFAHYLASS